MFTHLLNHVKLLVTYSVMHISKWRYEMSKSKSKNLRKTLSQLNEDMRVLQKQIAGRSVYAKERVVARRPKHPKQYFDEVHA
jgi:hypothetical protein